MAMQFKTHREEEYKDTKIGYLMVNETFYFFQKEN